MCFPKRLKIQPLHTGAIMEKLRETGSRSGMNWDCSVIDLLRLNHLAWGSFLELYSMHLFLGLENVIWMEVQRYQKHKTESNGFECWNSPMVNCLGNPIY